MWANGFARVVPDGWPVGPGAVNYRAVCMASISVKRLPFPPKIRALINGAEWTRAHSPNNAQWSSEISLFSWKLLLCCSQVGIELWTALGSGVGGCLSAGSAQTMLTSLFLWRWILLLYDEERRKGGERRRRNKSRDCILGQKKFCS